jgi:malic enzyme
MVQSMAPRRYIMMANPDPERLTPEEVHAVRSDVLPSRLVAAIIQTR